MVPFWIVNILTGAVPTPYWIKVLLAITGYGALLTGLSFTFDKTCFLFAEVDDEESILEHFEHPDADDQAMLDKMANDWMPDVPHAA